MADSAFLKKLITTLSRAWVGAFPNALTARQAAEALDSSLSAGGMVPIGGIIPWFGYNGLATVPAAFKLCDGSVVSDADSPLNGQTLPNLNTGASDPIFLGGYSSPGAIPTLVNSNLPTHTHSVGTLGATASIRVNFASASAGVAHNFTAVSRDTTHTIGTQETNTAVQAQSITISGDTGAPNIGDTTANQYPHHMKVTYIIRIK